MEKTQTISEECKSCYRQAIDVLDKAIVDDNVTLYAQASTLVEKCLVQAPKEPEFLYLAGYILFSTPNKDLETWVLSERHLKQCVELNPHHQLALYYLACNYFYRQMFDEALRYFAKIQTAVFLGMGQDWRVAKTKEMACCCGVYLTRTIQFKALEEVIQLYYAFSDISLAPVPRELAACFTFFADSGTKLDMIKQGREAFAKLLKYLEIENLIYTEFPKLAN